MDPIGALPDEEPWRLGGHDFARFRAPELRQLGLRLAVERWDSDPATRLIVEGLVLELVGTALRSGQPRLSGVPHWLRMTRDRLAAEFRSPPDVATLARDAGVNPTYLSRAFRRRFGVTPGWFIHRARVQWACQAMRESSDSLAAIAVEAGFADQSHFGRIFRRVMGTTPAKYRDGLGPVQ